MCKTCGTYTDRIARDEAEDIIRKAQGEIGFDIYANNPFSNSLGVNEAAIGVLTSMRNYLNEQHGMIVPGQNSAILWMQAVEGRKTDWTGEEVTCYALAHEIEFEPVAA